MRTAAERVFRQYTRFENRMLAVRGDRLALGWSLWSDEAGNEATHLHLVGVDEDGLINYHARFADDFDSAYRELESRYYAGEGADFAGAAWSSPRFSEQRMPFDVEAARLMCAPGFGVFARPPR